MARCEKLQWHGILGWQGLDKISWRGILMWREESSFCIGQDIGDYIGNNQRSFGLVQKAGSR